MLLPLALSVISEENLTAPVTLPVIPVSYMIWRRRPAHGSMRPSHVPKKRIYRLCGIWVPFMVNVLRLCPIGL